VTAQPATTYDSDQLRAPLVSEFRNLWEYRGLLRLLISRDLTVRYKRSALGVWWTLLNPLLTMTILWIIFSQFFRFEIPGDIPFAVYLLSGVLLVTFFAQGVNATGAAMVNNASVLSKVYVPPEIFAFSSGVAAATNFMIGLIPLFGIILITGTGIPWTAAFVPIPVIFLLGFTVGIGLLVAAAAVYFYDVLDLTGVLTQLVSYLVPTFYPISIVPDHFVWIIKVNPLYSYLVVFRGFVYEGVFAPGWNFLVMGVSSVVMLVVGVWVFSRSWKNLVVLL
jgi:ABC-2 type transport system permease protein